MSPSELHAVRDWLLTRDRFAIASHTDPDGDSLGSSLALAAALDALGKTSTVVIGQPLADRFRWLPDSERIVSSDRVPAEARAAVLIECSDFARSGVAGLDGIESLNVDHHTKNARYADLDWIDPGVAAAGMMVRDLIEALGVEITPPMATHLYITVLTDTGSFQHSNTDAAALRFASDMVAAGADASRIAERVFGSVPESRVRLMARALTTLTRSANGRVAWMVLTADDFERLGTRDTEGVINEAQAIVGVQVSLLLKEVERERFRVSLRSDGSADVAEIAARHGGGGHTRAAGCEIAAPLEAVVTGLLDEISAEIDRESAG